MEQSDLEIFIKNFVLNDFTYPDKRLVQNEEYIEKYFKRNNRVLKCSSKDIFNLYEHLDTYSYNKFTKPKAFIINVLDENISSVRSMMDKIIHADLSNIESVWDEANSFGPFKQIGFGKGTISEILSLANPSQLMAVNNIIKLGLA